MIPQTVLAALGVLTSLNYPGAMVAFSPRCRPSPPRRRLVSAIRRRPVAARRRPVAASSPPVAAALLHK